MTWKGKWPGTWASICDRCGLRLPSDKLKLEWTGLMVCGTCWEPRHPQDFIRLREETIVPPWVRPYPEDEFIFFCDAYSIQGVAGVGVAGCAQAGYSNPNLSRFIWET